MNPIKAVHHKLQLWQGKTSSRIVLSSILFLAVVVPLIFILVRTSTLYQDRELIFNALVGSEQTVLADELYETGFISLDGKSFGDIRLKGYKILDEDNRIINPVDATSLLISSAVPREIPAWLLRDPGLIWTLGLVLLAWCLISVWLGLFVTFLYSLSIGVFSWFFFRACGLHGLALVIVGMCALGYSYHLLLQCFRYLYQSPRPVAAISRGVLVEATRTKMSLAFLALLLVVLPVIPIMLDSDSPLRHQVQTMLSRSLGVTFTIAAFLTVFLGCATVAFEMRDRQIWQVLTKPVSRFGYLAGKWLGIVSLNFVILIIAGLSVFMYMQYLRTAPVSEGLQGDFDRFAVEEEVLTARVESLPMFESLSSEQIAARVEQIIEADTEIRNESHLQIQLRQKLREEVEDQFLAQQRSIPAMVDGQPYAQTYTFTNLQDAKSTGGSLTFSYRFYIGAVDDLETYKAGFEYNGDFNTRHPVTYVPGMTHVSVIPSNYITEGGELKITVFNLFEPNPQYQYKGGMSFDKDGIKLLYKVGNFESNFFRAILLLLIKLGFLAALAIAASTFLSFPVACLVTFTVFASAAMSPYLSQSLQYYFPPSTADLEAGEISLYIQWFFEHIVHAIATAIVFCLDAFGSQRPTDQLVNGMLITWGSVLNSFFKIGILWSGGILLIGTFILGKRQLAIYSGKG